MDSTLFRIDKIAIRSHAALATAFFNDAGNADDRFFTGFAAADTFLTAFFAGLTAATAFTAFLADFIEYPLTPKPPI